MPGLAGVLRLAGDLLTLAAVGLLFLLVVKSTDALFAHERWACAQRLMLAAREEVGTTAYNFVCTFDDSAP